ncbi:TIGR02391 family protein [Schaalia vaccimaxillae]|uniref:TIGR02391 family protein n=1 Tax=Schaalia vaccimaxillae TaxID=183916 RepID=UPI0003B3ED9A|nr:TIGR02391 family protein [Schaalia vaccimaxillae]
MNVLNIDWALEELDKFIKLSEMRIQGEGFYSLRVTVADSETLTKQWEVVERILDRADQGWRDKLVQPGDRDSEWLPMRMAAIRAREALARDEEIRKNLGDNAPELSAANLHPWVWGGASSLWQSGHYRAAVEGTIRKLNAETQNKLGRRDVSETDLFNQAFSEQPAAAKNPRLHRMPDDGSKTFKSVQRGARMLAEGVFAGIRNPLAHEADREMPEQEALEYLAALSVLARWVDESTLEVAS